MTPREKAALRALEIEDALTKKNLPAEERQDLENELDAICDNIAEGCYSNDPDDGIDWSDCPGISRTWRPEEGAERLESEDGGLAMNQNM